MKCPHCGAANAEGNTYCTKCGGKLAGMLHCPACGAANQADYAFCMKCGTALPSATGAGKPAKLAPAPAAPATAPAPAPTIIIQQEQKKRPAWALPLLVTGLLLTLICLVLVKSGVVDLPPIPFLEGILPDKAGAAADGQPAAMPQDDKSPIKCVPVDNQKNIFYSFGDVKLDVISPHVSEGLPVDGEVVITFPDTFYFFPPDAGEGEEIFFGNDEAIIEVIFMVWAWHKDSRDREDFECTSEFPTIRCPLPYLVGTIGYVVAGDLSAEIDECLLYDGYVEEILIVDNPPIEPEEEVCYSAEPFSFDAAKVNYWFTQTPTTDLHLSIINDQPFLHSGYTVWMAQPPAAPKISAECKVSATDPNRVDCTFPEFAGPSATWTVMMEHNGCVFFEKEVWVAMPRCPAGETYHEGHPYNNGCCTDGCWCELPTWGWGCWESCAAHCAN